MVGWLIGFTEGERLGLLALLAILLMANLFGGGFKGWLGQSEGEKIRAAAVGTDGKTMQGNGNIPGTNLNATSMPQGASDVPSGPTTTIQYESNEFDFQTVNEGEIVKHIYKFKNTGDVPLIISNCKGSCGCTVPTWPKEPIQPGADGEIKVEFNSKGKPGPQRKQVTVTANTTPTETFLVIKGEVHGKEQPVSKGN
jgi:hypothetical protein